MVTPVSIRPLKSSDPLSKSTFMKGQQCPTTLYFQLHTDAKATDASTADEARFALGNQVGALARQGFESVYGADKCELIAAEYWQQPEAVVQTLAAMQAGKLAIFEAGFTYGQVKIRVDAIERVGEDEYDLIEVKSTGSYKKAKHLWDAAIQLWVARGAGLNVRRVKLMHLDKTYLWPGGDYDLQKLMTTTDITSEVEELQEVAGAEVARLLTVLATDSVPAPPAGVKCDSPYSCVFTDYCEFIVDGPEHPIRELPYCDPSKKVYQALELAEIEELSQLDDDGAREMLSREDQYWTWKATVDAKPYMLDSAEAFFGAITYPMYFLDFETVNPALPLFIGTAPFEVIPVQYSIHVLSREGGELKHLEYIAHPGTADPRRDLGEALLRDLGTEGTILEWHGNGGYESIRIATMATLYPGLADALLALNDRMLDLAELVKKSFFHKDFHGSYSIKVVLPTLVPDMRSYSSMNIHNGDEAAIALVRVLTDVSMPDAEREQVVADLLAYCELDTEAMVDVWKALLAHREFHGCVRTPEVLEK